ncbi:MAG TPA: WhiB family transcriptional regulator, partial [Pseudonocardiaceae bacterium]|nr:WhiB family transcriptional regulator [Pseudonocardiaceae bacterium]
MLTATVPLDSGAPPDPCSEADLAQLLEASATGGATALPCRTHDPDLWFADSPSELERAKQLCTPCPVRHACLAAALSR